MQILQKSNIRSHKQLCVNSFIIAISAMSQRKHWSVSIHSGSLQKPGQKKSSQCLGCALEPVNKSADDRHARSDGTTFVSRGKLNVPVF